MKRTYLTVLFIILCIHSLMAVDYDAQVYYISVSSNPTINSPVEIVVGIKNLGTQPGTYQANLVIRKDEIVSNPIVFNQTISIYNINPGQTKTATFYWTPTVADDYKCIAKANNYNSSYTYDEDETDWFAVNEPQYDPIVWRIDPSQQNISVDIYDNQDFEIGASDQNGDLDYVKWYVDDVLKATHDTYFNGYDDTDTWDFDFDIAGSHIVKAVVYDDMNGHSFTSWNVSVVNHSPTITRISPNTPYSCNMGDNITFKASVYEPDGEGDFDRVEWRVNSSLSETDNYSSVWWSNPHISEFTYSFNASGNFTVKAEVFDKSGAHNSITWSVTVNNPPPVFASNFPTYFNKTEDCGSQTLFDIDGYVSDPNDDDDELTIIPDPNGTDSWLGATIGSDHKLKINPQANAYGTGNVKIKVSDANNNVYKNVTIEIDPVNDPPVFSNIPNQNEDEDSINEPVIDLDDFVSDVDNTNSQLTFNHNAESWLHVQINSSSHVLTCSPDQNESGSDNFTVTVHDPSGASDSESFTLTINQVNDPPTATRENPTSPNLSFTQGDIINLTAHGVDIDNNLEYAIWYYDGNYISDAYYDDFGWGQHDEASSEMPDFMLMEYGNHTISCRMYDSGQDDIIGTSDDEYDEVSWSLNIERKTYNVNFIITDNQYGQTMPGGIRVKVYESYDNWNDVLFNQLSIENLTLDWLLAPEGLHPYELINEDTPGTHEYWGSSAFNIINTESFDVNRLAPFESGSHLAYSSSQNAQNNANPYEPGNPALAGQQIFIPVKVTNNQNFSVPVKVYLYINDSESYLNPIEVKNEALAANSTQTFIYDYFIPESIDDGTTLKINTKIESEYNNNYLLTDSYNLWYDLPIVNTPPKVLDDHEPTIDEVEVPITDYIWINFDNQLNPSSIENPNNFIISSGDETVSGTIEYTYNAQISNFVKFIPDSFFDYGKEYTVTLTTGIEDLAGNTLDGNRNGVSESASIDNYIYSFTTEITNVIISGYARSNQNDFDIIPNATVTIDGNSNYQAQTTSNGYYEITGVPSGVHTIVISHSGNAYDWDAEEITRYCGPNTFQDFTGSCKAQPEITYNIPATYEPGVPFNVTVNLKNTGYAVSNVPAYLDLSFPGVTNDSYNIQVIDYSGFDNEPEFYNPESNICRLNLNSNNWNCEYPADYLLISGVRTGTIFHNQPWSFTVRITPVNIDEIVLFVKASIGDKRSPANSETVDQQNLYVKEIHLYNSQIPWGDGVEISPTGGYYIADNFYVIKGYEDNSKFLVFSDNELVEDEHVINTVLLFHNLYINEYGIEQLAYKIQEWNTTSDNWKDVVFEKDSEYYTQKLRNQTRNKIFINAGVAVGGTLVATAWIHAGPHAAVTLPVTAAGLFTAALVKSVFDAAKAGAIAIPYDEFTAPEHYEYLRAITFLEKEQAAMNYIETVNNLTTLKDKLFEFSQGGYGIWNGIETAQNIYKVASAVKKTAELPIVISDLTLSFAAERIKKNIDANIDMEANEWLLVNSLQEHIQMLTRMSNEISVSFERISNSSNIYEVEKELIKLPIQLQLYYGNYNEALFSQIYRTENISDDLNLYNFKFTDNDFNPLVDEETEFAQFYDDFKSGITNDFNELKSIYQSTNNSYSELGIPLSNSEAYVEFDLENSIIEPVLIGNPTIEYISIENIKDQAINISSITSNCGQEFSITAINYPTSIEPGNSEIFEIEITQLNNDLSTTEIRNTCSLLLSGTMNNTTFEDLVVFDFKVAPSFETISLTTDKGNVRPNESFELTAHINSAQAGYIDILAIDKNENSHVLAQGISINSGNNIITTPCVIPNTYTCGSYDLKIIFNNENASISYRALRVIPETIEGDDVSGFDFNNVSIISSSSDFEIAERLTSAIPNSQILFTEGLTAGDLLPAMHSDNLILVGGDQVNILVEYLVSHDILPNGLWVEPGDSHVFSIENPFFPVAPSGNRAIVVAGFDLEDTFMAGIKLLNIIENNSSQINIPEFSPAPPYYFNSILPVTITCASEDVTIHYTTDGSDPDENSPIGTEIILAETTTLKARSYKEGFIPSDIAVGQYTYNLTSYKISGTVKNINDQAIENVTVNLSGSQTQTTQTNSSGYYEFVDLPEGGDYAVIPVSSLFSFVPQSTIISALSQNEEADYVINSKPQLTWANEVGFEDDGVSPNSGISNTTFEFRVKYTDQENNYPLANYPKLVLKRDGQHINGSPFTLSAQDDNLPNQGKVYATSMTLEESDQYTYYFQAVDDENAVATGTPTSITEGPIVTQFINEPPLPFVLLSPLNVVIQNQMPLLTWETSSDPEETNITYDLIISTNFYYNNGDTIFGLSDNFYQLNYPLLDNANIFWKVRARDEDGIFTYSTPLNSNFYINMENDLPGTFSLVSPANENILDNLSPIFEWTESENIDPSDVIKYTLLVASEPSFTDGSYFEFTNISNTSFQPNISFQYDTYYYWKVKAIDLLGEVVWSNETSWWFRTPSNILPILNFVDEEGYINDAVNPNTVNIGDPLTFKVIYTDAEAQNVAEGYPLLHVFDNGVEIGSSPLSMSLESGTNPLSGLIYSANISTLSPSYNYSYYFEAYDSYGGQATGPASEIITGFVVLPPHSISMLKPNGGEQVQIDNQYLIEWDFENIFNSFKLEYSIDGGNSYNLIEDNIDPNNSSYSWNTPSQISDLGLVKISGYYFNDEVLSVQSSGYFSLIDCIPITEPVISEDQIICFNSSPDEIERTVDASGGDGIITYTWESSQDALNWLSIDGETESIYQAGLLTETTYYRTVATDGCSTVYSNVICITVPNELITSVSDNQILCYNNQADILTSITTGGKGTYQYQWQKLETDWVDIVDANTDSYQAPINDNHQYRLMVTDDCTTATSNTVEIITYNPLSLSLTEDQVVCGNDAAETLVATADGGASNYNYEWYEKTTGDWNEIVGATQSTYEPGVLSEATYFKVELTDVCGVVEEETFVDIYPEMDILLSSTSETVCYQAYTSSFTATVSGGDGTYQYQWYKWINEDTVAIVGQTSNILAPQYIEEETTFVLGVFNACGFTLSELININMYLPLSTLASSSQTICYNSAPAVLSAYASGGHGTNSYQWQQLADGSWVDIPNADQLYYQPEALTSTTSYRMEFSNECDLIYSNAVEITVLDPVMVTVSDDQIICDGTVPALLSAVASGGDLSYTFQWQILQGGNWTDITDAVADEYLPDAVAGETHYRVVVTNTCATVESEEIIVGVYDPFVAGSIEGDQILCFGETPLMLTSATMPSGGAENYAYQWQDSLVGGNWADIPGATSQDYQPEILPDTAYFRLICVDVCETAISNVLEVGVYDEMMPGSIGTDQLICFGAIPSPLTITTAAQGGNSVFTYQWQQSVDNANWTDIQDETDATYQPPSISEEIYYRLQFTSVVGCGVLYSNAVNVNIVPLPIAAAGVDDGVCETNSFQLNAMADNFESLSWASSGDGTFDDNTVLNPVYTPGTNDLALGTAILTLTANPIYPCQNAATDDLMLTIVYLPEADAGTDATICENYSYEITTATASNYSQISWEGGDGSFVNGSTLNPTYIYGPNDLLNGGVTLTMTAYSMVACATEASDEMYLTIAYQPVVTAMEDTTICEIDCLELDATVENATNITWTTNGDGTFNNIHFIQATYCPGTNDIASGSVELTITAVPSGVCTQNASDSFTLSITNGPIVDAGVDITSCASADEIPITDASAQHFGSLLWTSSGDGSFSNTAALSTSYSPGTQDASSGSVTLTLTAESLDPCVLTATDNLTINLSPLPTANAGSDIEVCENESITLSGSATNYSTLHWSNISGDGTFDCTDCLSPIFTPGTTDINNGFVTVVFTVSAIDPCSEEVTDTMQITIQEGPFAYAGIDGEICAGENYTLSGFVQNNTGRHWSTSGDGSFSNTNFLNATYYPGSSDIASGSVVITLHAGATAPCTGETTDDMTITIHALPIVDAGNDFTVMQNTEVQLNGSMSGGSGNLTPHWSPESLLYNPSVLNPNTMPIPSTTQFTLTVVDNAYGCENSDVVTLIVEPGVTYNISGAIISQNLRNPIENAWVRFHGDYFADSTTTHANGNYSIDIPSGWCGWSSVNYPGYIFIPDSTEILFLDHDITDGAFSGTIFLEAVANPDTVDLGDPVSLNAVVHNPNGTVTYQWSSIPEGFESSVQNPEDFPLTSTLYKVIVSDQFETSWDTVSVFVDTLAVGFSEHEGNIVFKVYPNPTKDYLFVEVEGENELQYIRILTVEGQIAEEKKVSLGSHFIKKSFNVQSHPNGVYFIELVTKDGLTIKSKRFVKIAY